LQKLIDIIWSHLSTCSRVYNLLEIESEFLEIIVKMVQCTDLKLTDMDDEIRTLTFGSLRTFCPQIRSSASGFGLLDSSSRLNFWEQCS
jgi:hypothetical protein